MANAFREPMDLSESQTRSFEARLGLLVDRELTVRRDRRRTTRVRQATWRLSASAEAIDDRHSTFSQVSMLALFAAVAVILFPSKTNARGSNGSVNWRRPPSAVTRALCVWPERS